MMRQPVLRNRHRNKSRPAEKSAPSFLAWMRKRPCYCEWSGDCSGKIEAAHVDHAGGKGVGTKVADRHAIPLCSGHHAEQHRIGWRSFEAKYEFDAVRVSDRYWSAWPGKMAWENKRA